MVTFVTVMKIKILHKHEMSSRGSAWKLGFRGGMIIQREFIRSLIILLDLELPVSFETTADGK